jgi:formate hydrogenlyase subunit 6/NADH:ubiquinone oxidoreductase subunit I
MTLQELPALDAVKCISCGDCVALCPADCLAMAGPVPWLPCPGNCVACAACVLVCPTEALRLERVADSQNESATSRRPLYSSFGDGLGGGG